MSAFPILDPGQVTTVLNEPGLVLLDFWQATCAPCRALEPRLDQVAQSHPGEFRGYRIDVDTDEHTPARFGVQSIPTLVWLREGHEIARQDGLIRDTDLEQALRDSGGT